jgi:hypothetical protein
VKKNVKFLGIFAQGAHGQFAVLFMNHPIVDTEKMPAVRRFHPEK